MIDTLVKTNQYLDQMTAGQMLRQGANALTALRVWNETEYIAENEDDFVRNIQHHLCDQEDDSYMQDWALDTGVDLLLLGRYLGNPRGLAESLVFVAAFYAFADLCSIRASQREARKLAGEDNSKEQDADTTHQAAD
jgi:hypothetical protein